ncbi:MAG: hypothetical protein IPL32_17735 [Chloracidobacterium sp.]|nr:hypothetical protein [Chloracidobacterium sp.]
MSFDLDSLAPGIDLDAVDIASMDKGDTLEALEEALAEPATEEVAKEEAPAVEETSKEEPSAEEEASEEPPRNDKGQFEKKEAKIPKSRFDEQVGKERAAREAAERRAEALEKQLSEQATNTQQSADIQALEDQATALYAKADEVLLDGDAKAAAELRNQARKIDKHVSAIEADARSRVTSSNVLEADRLESAIARLEADHPVLNPKSEMFDKSLVTYVLAEQQLLVKTEGYSPSAAMALAAQNVLGRFNPAASDPGEEEADEKAKGLSKAAEERKTAQVRKNLSAAKAQPSNMKDVGLDSDKAGQNTGLPDVTKLSQEEFNALPEKTRARLRGDEL